MLEERVIRRKLSRAKQRVLDIEERQRVSCQTRKVEEVFNFHGGWSYGYWQGRVSMLEDLLDEYQKTV